MKYSAVNFKDHFSLDNDVEKIMQLLKQNLIDPIIQIKLTVENKIWKQYNLWVFSKPQIIQMNKKFFNKTFFGFEEQLREEQLTCFPFISNSEILKILSQERYKHLSCYRVTFQPYCSVVTGNLVLQAYEYLNEKNYVYTLDDESQKILDSLRNQYPTCTRQKQNYETTDLDKSQKKLILRVVLFFVIIIFSAGLLFISKNVRKSVYPFHKTQSEATEVDNDLFNQSNNALLNKNLFLSSYSNDQSYCEMLTCR